MGSSCSSWQGYLHHPGLPPQRIMSFEASAEQDPKGGEGFLQPSVKGGYLSKNWLHLMG